MRKGYVPAATLLLLVLASGGVARRAAGGAVNYEVQAVPPTSSPFPDASVRGGREERERDPNYERMQEQAAKSRNVERQKRLMADTDKLLSLATDLKQDVEKTDKNTLSVDVIKKADEIEKLAHSVKERMKG